MARRSLWKGSLSFGLVSIPVEMYLASRDRELKFILLHDKDFAAIRYARICKAEEVEVPWNHVVKGYETEKGELTIMSDEDFLAARSERSENIDIKQFAHEDEVDSIFFEKPYYLEPRQGASKGYALLVAALKKSKKVGIARYVLHNREHLGLIKAHNDHLILNQLRYESELVKATELKFPKISSIPGKEMDMALLLIEEMSEPFSPKKYKDTYVSELTKAIKRKTSKEKVKAPTERAPKAKVYDLMTALKASLAEKGKKTKTRAP